MAVAISSQKRWTTKWSAGKLQNLRELTPELLAKILTTSFILARIITAVLMQQPTGILDHGCVDNLFKCTSNNALKLLHICFVAAASDTRANVVFCHHLT